MAEYIDKAYALEILQQSGDAYGTFSVERSMYLIAKQKIKNIAPADVVPVKHGKWMSVDADVIFSCSNCENEVSTSWDYDAADMFTYCPCCGAKMDLKEEAK